MNLSKDAIKLLRWLSRHDEWQYRFEIQSNYKHYDYRSFNALETAKLMDSCVFEDEVVDYDEYGNAFFPKHYRISDAGKAYLEGRITKWLPELRGWVAIVISIFALLVSVISLIL